MSSTRRPNPRGNLIFKDVTSDGDDCDSHVEGEQDEEGKGASGEAHDEEGQRRSRGVRMCPMPNKGFKVADEPRSSSMTAQLAAQRVHVLGEVMAGSLAG